MFTEGRSPISELVRLRLVLGLPSAPMSVTLKVSSVHISGSALSYLLAAAYATAPATKYFFTLYGHCDRRTEVTDTSASSEVFDIIVVGAVPLNAKFCGNADPVGLLSISKSPYHKLSFQDTAFLQGSSGINAEKQRGETGPKIFVLMTEDVNSGRTSGTLKVEFTAYQVSSGSGTPYRVVPMKTDNVVDSLQGFTAIADTCCRNPSILHATTSDSSKGVDGKGNALEPAVQCIENASKERANLIKRIESLHKAIEAKKAAAVKRVE